MSANSVALRRRLSFVVGAIVVALATLGCGGYGKVSPAAYEYAKALYSISNRRATDRLDGVERKLAAARDKQELTEQEYAWFETIVADARGGQWDAACAACRRMMEDQVQPVD